MKAGNEDIPLVDSDTGETYYIAQRMGAWWGRSSDKISAHSYHIYYEVLDGEGDREYNGKQYKLVKTLDFVAAHNGSTRVDPFDYNGYKCINDTRGENNVNLNETTDYQKNSNNYQNTPTNKNNGRYNCPDSDQCDYCNCFYYDREDYQLSFYNHNQATNDAGKTFAPVMMKFEEDLANGLPADVIAPDYKPPYPDGLDVDGYYFDGWYTTDKFVEGTRVDWTKDTMPAGAVTLYAKWAPIIHKVEVYLDDDLTTQLGATQSVPHDSYASKVDAPVHPDGLEFVTWMYKTKDENGNTVEKAFNFSMQIEEDMKIYAVWRSDTVINYQINYVGIDTSGREFVIAAPSKGQQLWGKTETFEPKGTDQYYLEYQDDGYFAKTAAHSIVMGKNCNEGNADCTWDPDTKTHTFTFYYELGPVVPYEVHYYFEGTTNPVFVDANGKEIFDRIEDNRKSVVVATAKMAVGYKVDAPQKSLVVVKDEENKIIFYYSKDEKVSYYTVTHYLICKDGSIKVYQSIPYNAQVGDKVENTSANVVWLDIPGFTRDVDNPNNLREGTVAESPILELKMYYVETEVTIRYEVAGNVGGTVSVSGEKLGAQYGVPAGSIAIAADGYKFVGWYSHWDCLDSQWLSDDPHYKPTKAETALWADGTTYYAKFEVSTTTLTIVKDGVVGFGTVDLNQTFIFNIKGNGVNLDVTVNSKNGWSTTIDGLTVGATYTVTEKTDWSWRYQCEGWTHGTASGKGNVATITLGLDGTITFTNSRPNIQWLDGDSWCDNVFNAFNGKN